MENRADISFPNGCGGFNFENNRRNEAFAADINLNGQLPKPKKTGTTICGAIYNGGVVLGADTRSTSDLVVEKNCRKIHYISKNIYCCGAGTAADTEFTTNQISSQLELYRLNTHGDKQPRVVTALTMLKRHLYGYQGHVSAALVLGGVDVNGAHLHTVYPHGSVDTLPFVSMGSGSLAAMSVLESGYKDNLTKDECVTLVARAIRAGVMNDLGSGSNVDYCIIENNGNVDYRRGCELKPGLNEISRSTVELNKKSNLTSKVKLPKYFANWPKGTTIVLEEPLVENF